MFLRHSLCVFVVSKNISNSYSHFISYFSSFSFLLAEACLAYRYCVLSIHKVANCHLQLMAFAAREAYASAFAGLALFAAYKWFTYHRVLVSIGVDINQIVQSSEVGRAGEF